MIKKSLKEHFLYLFENEKPKEIVKRVSYTGTELEVNDVKDALSIILCFNFLHAYLTNDTETMLQSAYGGEKVKDLDVGSTKVNTGKTIDLDKLESPSGFNLVNATAYANSKEEVANKGAVRNFVNLVKEAIEFLTNEGINSVMLESKNVKINKAKFIMTSKLILGDKLPRVLDKSSNSQIIKIDQLLAYIRENIDTFVKIDDVTSK